MDTRALAHILAQSEIYQKPEVARASLAQILGDGVLVVEGELFALCSNLHIPTSLPIGAKHRQQRRIMVWNRLESVVSIGLTSSTESGVWSKPASCFNHYVSSEIYRGSVTFSAAIVRSKLDVSEAQGCSALPGAFK